MASHCCSTLLQAKQLYITANHRSCRLGCDVRSSPDSDRICNVSNVAEGPFSTSCVICASQNMIQAVMAKGWRKAFMIILAVTLLAAESSLQASAQTADLVRVLVLNSQWNSAYAKAACESAGIWYKTVGKEIEPLGCENFPACPDLMATAKACRSADATAALRDFEQKIIGSLASDAACAHVTVVRYTGVGDAVYDNLAKLTTPRISGTSQSTSIPALPNILGRLNTGRPPRVAMTMRKRLLAKLVH